MAIPRCASGFQKAPQPTPSSFSHSKHKIAWRSFDHDSDRYSCLDADWCAAIVAAQPQLGVSTSRWTGTDPDHHFDSVHAGLRMKTLIRLMFASALALPL